MEAGTATMPILKLSWLHYLHLPYILVTRFNMSSSSWYLLENSQHNPKWSEKSHTKTSKCDRMKQTAVNTYCLYVHTFSLSQIQVFWDTPLCHWVG